MFTFIRMAAMGDDVLAGFVAATHLVQGMVVATGASAVAQAAAAAPVGASAAVEVGADAPDGGVAADAPDGGPRPPMRWNNNTSRFILMRMAQILSDGSRADKLFKDKNVNCVAKTLREYTRDVVSPTQVYNHLRKWKQEWSRVCKLKDLSGANFDEDVHAIMLDLDHYHGHCKVRLTGHVLILSTSFFAGLSLYLSELVAGPP
jgi:hypothetical protein